METVLQSKKHPKIVVKSAFERLQKVLLTDYRVICIKKVKLLKGRQRICG